MLEERNEVMAEIDDTPCQPKETPKPKVPQFMINAVLLLSPDSNLDKRLHQHYAKKLLSKHPEGIPFQAHGYVGVVMAFSDDFASAAVLFSDQPEENENLELTFSINERRFYHEKIQYYIDPEKVNIRAQFYSKARHENRLARQAATIVPEEEFQLAPLSYSDNEAVKYPVRLSPHLASVLVKKLLVKNHLETIGPIYGYIDGENLIPKHSHSVVNKIYPDFLITGLDSLNNTADVVYLNPNMPKTETTSIAFALSLGCDLNGEQHVDGVIAAYLGDFSVIKAALNIVEQQQQILNNLIQGQVSN